MTPAERIIEKFGGAAKLAELLQVDVSRVYRWTYPADRGGTGGLIPTKHQHRLIEIGRDHGIKIAPADFFSKEAA